MSTKTSNSVTPDNTSMPRAQDLVDVTVYSRDENLHIRVHTGVHLRRSGGWIFLGSGSLCCPIGLQDSVIRRIPSRRYEERDDVDSCSVCIETFSSTCEVKQLPCGHLFHANCINRWLHRSATCPFCRLDLHQHFTNDTFDVTYARV